TDCHRPPPKTTQTAKEDRYRFCLLCRFDEVFIIIDALDECPAADQNRTTFIGGVRGLLPKVRLMVTSRDIPSIAKIFRSDLHLHIRATDQDVKLFVESQIDQKAELSDLLEDHDDVRSMITATVVGKSHGMLVSSETSTDSGSPDDRFLIAVLHMDSLAKEDNLRDLKEAVHRLPEDLDKTYDEALDRINRQDSRRLARANQVLKLIKLRQAATEAERNATSFVSEALISTCCGLVVVEEESQTVRLVHYTTEEYFERKQQHLRSPEAHQYFCGQLITYLGFNNIPGRVLEDEIAEEEMADKELAELRERILSDILGKLFSEKKDPDLVIYGAENWGYHARQAFARLESRPRDKSRDLEQQIDLYLRKAQNIYFANRILCYIEWRQRPFCEELSSRYSEGAISLHTAATHGVYPLVENYLNNGADVNAADTEGRTALHNASRHGYLDIVQLLLDHGAAIDIQDRFGGNALLQAVYGIRLPVTRLLLRNGLDPCSSTTALMSDIYSSFELAARLGYQPMLELLVEFETHPVAMSRLLGGALIEAAKHGQESVMPVVDVNQQFHHLGRPLIHAVILLGNSEALARLLEKGADVDALDAKGNTALVYLAEAPWYGLNQIATAYGLNQAPMARQLLEAAADINATGGKSQSNAA
ncbi:MAG: hypothetical protein Q9173_006135, partial [Seirophora scorigena]